MSKKTVDTHGLQRIAVEADVSIPSARAAYRGSPTRSRTHRRVAAAAKALGFAAPPSRVAPAGETQPAQTEARIEAARFYENDPARGPVMTAPTAEDIAALAACTADEIRILRKMGVSPAAYIAKRDGR